MIRQSKLQEIIDLHDSMKSSYFFTSPGNAASRRTYEKERSMTTKFTIPSKKGEKGDKVEVVQETSCSCKNIYYSMKIYINGKETNKNIRFLKKFLKK